MSKIEELEIDVLKNMLHVSESVARELYLLAGKQPDIVLNASKKSNGLTECKARILNERMLQSETRIDRLEGGNLYGSTEDSQRS